MWASGVSRCHHTFTALSRAVSKSVRLGGVFGDGPDSTFSADQAVLCAPGFVVYLVLVNADETV